MIVVIIAGGSGTRLWPLSTPDYPKHLLAIDGGDKSLLQTTYGRAKALTDNIYVATENSHIEHVRQQLADLREDAFIVEPARRGTAGCIIAALHHIAQRHNADEPIAFMHADHYIRDTEGFLHSLRTAAEAAREHQRIVLIGIEPTYASTGFGYIKKNHIVDEQRYIFAVDSFKEKPGHDTATKYVASGNYLWNGGYFVASLNTFTKTMETTAPKLLKFYNDLNQSTPETYQDIYLEFEAEAIDYALLEKAPQELLVLPASFDWMDLGSFSDLHAAVGGDEQGNHVTGKAELEDVQNAIVQNHEDKPVAVIGLENIAVINTPHGLVVTRKDASQKVGDVSKRFKR